MRRPLSPGLSILVACVLAFLVSGEAVLAQDGGKTADMGELKRIIYVPREEFMRVIDPSRQGRVIEFEEYLRLERLATGVSEPEPHPPLPLAVTSAHYQGTVGETQAAMFAGIEFSTLVKGWVTLSVELGGAALAYPKLDGRDALIRPVRGGISILVPQKGDHVLRAMVFIPVRNTPDGKHLSARLPATGATHVSLSIPGKVEIKSSIAATQKKYDSVSDTTSAEVFLGKDRDFALTFRGEEKRAEMLPLVIARVEQQTLFDIAGSRTTATLTVDSHRAPIDVLRVGIDSDAQVSDLSVTDMLDWSQSVSGGQTLLEVRFRKPVNLAIVHLTLERETKALKRELPHISILQAGLQAWALHAASAADVRAEFLSAGNVRQVSHLAAGRKQDGSIAAFETWRADHKVVFEVTPVAAKVESVIAQVFNIRRERILLDANCFFRVLRGREYRLVARIPANWEILRVKVLRGAGFDHSITKKEGRSIIELTSPVGVGAGDGVAVSIQARLVPEDKGGDKWRGLAFDMPRIEMPGTDFKGGTVALGKADYLALLTTEMSSLHDIDVAEAGVSGAALAYRIVEEDYSGRISATKKESRILASVTTALNIDERLLGVRSLVTLNILESPVDSFEISLPKGTGGMVQFEGPSIKERTLIEEEGRDLWRITLQREFQGVYQLLVTFDLPVEGESQKLEAPNIAVIGAYRQDGFVAIEAGEGIEIGATAVNMEEVFVSEVPYLSSVRSPKGTGIFVHAFTYSRRDHSLALDVRKHELQEVITCVVPHAGYRTLVTEDGVERTEAVYHVRSVGEQFFAFTLPEGSALWSVLLGRELSSLLPVKPLSQGGRVLVPLTAASGQGTRYFVRVVYERPHEPMSSAGSIALDVPEVSGGPVIAMAWDTYAPRGYRYFGHGGAANYDMEKVVSKTIFDSLFYPIFVIAAIGVGLYLLVLGVKRMPKIRITPSFRRSAVGAVVMVVIVALIAAISIPNLLESKKSANESSAISSLRTLSSCQEQHKARYGTYASLGTLCNAGLIDRVLGGGSKSGYTFSVHADRENWYAYARPTTPATGERAFYIDRTGVIQYTDDGSSYRVVGGNGEGMDYTQRETTGVTPTSEPSVASGPRAGEGEYDSTLRRAMFKTPRVPADKMAEKPHVMLEEEAEITRDIPSGTSFDNLSNKNLKSASSKDARKEDATLGGTYGRRWGKGGKAETGYEVSEKADEAKANDIVFLEAGGRIEGRIVGRQKGAFRIAMLNGAVQDIPEDEIDSIYQGDGTVLQIGQRKGAARKGILSMVIRLRRSGEKGEWSALSGGGRITMSYVSTGIVYTICFILTFASMIVFMLLEKQDLRIKVLYAVALVIVFGSLPAVAGGLYPYCNAVMLGLLLGVVYYQVRNLLAAIRAAIRPVLITAALLAVALTLFLQPGTVYAQQGEEKELPPIKPTDMVIPYDTKDLLRAKGAGSILLSEERYMKLLERAGLVKPISIERPPSSSCISGAYFEATLLEDRMDVRGTYAIAVLAKGKQKIDLGLNGLAISDASLDGDPAVLVSSEGGGYGIVMEGPKRARLSLAFSLPCDPERASGELAFEVEPVVASVLDVRVGLQTDVKVASAIGGQSEIHGKESKIVRAILGPLGKVSLSWQPHRIFEPGLGLRTIVSSVLNYRVDRDVVQFDGAYSYTVRGEEIGGVSFAVPANLEIFAVSCPEIRLWRLVEGEQRRLEVVLQSAAGRSFAVKVSGVFFPPEDGSSYSLPALECRDVERETGTVVLTHHDTVKMQIADRKGLRRTPGAGGAPAGYGVHSTYAYLGQPFSVEVMVESGKTDLRADTSALLVIGTEQTYLRIESGLSCSEQPVYDLYVRIPAGFRIESVSCTNMESYFVHEGEDAARLHLMIPRGLPKSSGLLIECSRRTPADISKVSIPEVSIENADSHRGEIVVAAEPGLLVNTGELSGLSSIGVDKVSVNKSLLGLSRVQQAFKFAEEGYSGELLVTRLEPKLSATAITALTVRGEVLAYAAILEYVIEDAACQEFRFKIPEWVKESLSIEGAFLREKLFSNPDAESRVEVTVKLQHDVLETYSLVLYWEADPTEGVQHVMPALEPLDTQRGRAAYVLVQATADLRFIQGESEKVEIVDSAKVPHLDRFRVSDARVLLAVKALEFPYYAAFELERPKKAAEIEAIIDNAEYTVVVNKAGYSYNRAQFHVQNRAKQYLKVRMPEGALLWTADVAGVPVKPARLPEHDGEIVLVPLLKQSEEDISYFVSVYYGLQLPKGFSRVEPKLAEPLEISVEESYVSVYLPEQYSYGYDTNMDEVIKSVKEVAKGQTILAEAARITDIMKKEKDMGRLARLNKQLELLNFSLREQLENAKSGQRSAQTEESWKQKQYYWNEEQLATQETGLSENTAYTRHVHALIAQELREQEAMRRQQERERLTQQRVFDEVGQQNLSKYVQEQQQAQQSLQRQRFVSPRREKGSETEAKELLDAIRRDDDKEQREVSAPSLQPVAAFGASPAAGGCPLAVRFFDQSGGEITSWTWYFGDGYTSTAQNPSHTYRRPGRYTVTLSVSGPGGADSMVRDNYIACGLEEKDKSKFAKREERLKPDAPLEKPVPDKEADEIPTEDEPPPETVPVTPPAPRPEFFADPGLIVDSAHGAPWTARAAGIQPLRIELPEYGVGMHFKKLGANPKLTIYPSSTAWRIGLGYFVRMAVALGLLAFCMWRGVSLFGRHGAGRTLWEGAVALGVIVIVLGSTILAIAAACAIGIYFVVAYSVWRKILGTTL